MFHIFNKLELRGLAPTIKAAKKMVENQDPVVWDILEEVIYEHPVMLNRAPTLHRLGIQAFEPLLIEGKAIQLHPLVCAAFNADFDGDQMAVHVPLSLEAQLEARSLMLASNNVLFPANGDPSIVPSQDIVLGLYYSTRSRINGKGEGMFFADIGEVERALANKVVELQTRCTVRVKEFDVNKETGEKTPKLVRYETTVGRALLSEIPPGLPFSVLNKTLKKKEIAKLINMAFRRCGLRETVIFADKLMQRGYHLATIGGLSIAIDDMIVPEQKNEIVHEAEQEVKEIDAQYTSGLVTAGERYNKVVDIWGRTTEKVGKVMMDEISNEPVIDRHGNKTTQESFNSIYMMADSGARGSATQIRQLAGMRGLMAKPDGSIIETPITANFREGLNVLQYFVSTHGARKGLADTALKTANSGYLTRRLVDVTQDLVVTEDDCGTHQGVLMKALVEGGEVTESLADRILGRVTADPVINPDTQEEIFPAGHLLEEDDVELITKLGIDEVKIRTPLTCETRYGLCAKCYGRDLGRGKLVNAGEAVGVIAAQSIGEPGTQLTLRTFHVGGIASNIATENSITSKYDGILEIDELRAVEAVDEVSGKKHLVVVSRLAEMRIVDPNTKIVLLTHNIPYGSKLFFNNGDSIKKGDVIIEWDPFNAVIVSEVSGKIEFESLVENVTYKVESDETTGLKEKIIIESKDKTKAPAAHIVDENGNYLKNYSLPLGAHVVKDNGDVVKAGEVLVKIPRAVGKAGDITGGLPRVTELFEARNPSNPAVVSEIDGEVGFGKIKRGNREITVTSKLGEVKKYMVPLSKQLLVQENDYIRAGMPLSDGATTPSDILAIKGPTAVQEYIVNEVQDVYRLQGVKINDKHFEVIVRQMMRKVEVVDPGDTRFLEQQIVDKLEVMDENDRIWGKKVVTDPGDSQTLQAGQIVTARKLRDENSMLKRRDLKLVEVRDAIPATANQILQGITRAALQTNSFMSAASFQETTKVLNEAAINGKVDRLEGLKENVICGHLIPAGTGQREFDKLIVGAKDEFDRIFANRKNVVDFNAMDKDDEE